MATPTRTTKGIKEKNMNQINMMKLGDKIEINHKLKRVRQYEDHSRNPRKIWQKMPLNEPIEATVIGVRNLSNGISQYQSEIGYIYSPTHYFKAVLVVTSLRKSPFYVTLTED